MSPYDIIRPQWVNNGQDVVAMVYQSMPFGIFQQNHISHGLLWMGIILFHIFHLWWYYARRYYFRWMNHYTSYVSHFDLPNQCIKSAILKLHYEIGSEKCRPYLSGHNVLLLLLSFVHLYARWATIKHMAWMPGDQSLIQGAPNLKT